MLRCSIIFQSQQGTKKEEREKGRQRYHKMTLIVRKWTRGSDDDPFEYPISDVDPIPNKKSASTSNVSEGETSVSNELNHVPLHDMPIRQTLQDLIRTDARIYENAKRLKEELSIQFHHQLLRRHERPLPITVNEGSHIPLWVTIVLGICVPLLIGMVVRELIRIKTWQLEILKYEEYQRQYNQP